MELPLGNDTSHWPEDEYMGTGNPHITQSLGSLNAMLM